MTKPLGDLLVVIVGVTMAFALTSWSEQKNEEAERKKVMNSLRKELEEISQVFPRMVEYQEDKISH